MKRGDVAVIVARGELGKPRPAVIVQANEMAVGTTSLLVCPITSELIDDASIRPTVEPSAGNGLRVRSQIMTDKAFALERSRIRRTVGALDRAVTEQMDRALLIVLGLAR